MRQIHRTNVWRKGRREEDLCILTAEAIHTSFVGVYTEPAAKLPKRKQHSLAFRETEPEVERLFVDYYLAECLAQDRNEG